MNKFYLGFAALLLCASSYAQTTTTTTTATTDAQPQASNCYTRWEQKFEERGADDVKDGKIISMQRQLADGTYEEYKPKLKYEVPMTITNGISATLLTPDDDLINVIFPKTLKPKKVGYSSAPDPPQD